MTWKYILFDLDGTLTDSSEGILNCIKYALEAAGRDIPDTKSLMRMIGPPLMEGFQEVIGMDRQEAAEATMKYRERYNVIGLFENKPYEGIQQLLAGLKKEGKCLALATSKQENCSMRILRHFHLTRYFDVIVGSTLDGSRITKQEVIQEVFQRFRLKEEQKKETIMVGDRRQDILGAKACGIASLGVYYGFAEQGELEQAGADYITRSVKETGRFLAEREEGSDGERTGREVAGSEEE